MLICEVICFQRLFSSQISYENIKVLIWTGSTFYVFLLSLYTCAETIARHFYYKAISTRNIYCFSCILLRYGNGSILILYTISGSLVDDWIVINSTLHHQWIVNGSSWISGSVRMYNFSVHIKYVWYIHWLRHTQIATVARLDSTCAMVCTQYYAILYKLDWRD